MIKKEDAFIKEIDRISNAVIDNGYVEYDSHKFKESFFYQSSHSPDNLTSMEIIEYGDYWNETTERKNYGLKIKEKNIPISKIHYSIEGDDEVVGIIAKKFPDLTREEIEAAQRVITIILSGLELDDYGINCYKYREEIKELTELLRFDEDWNELRVALQESGFDLSKISLATFMEDEEEYEYGIIVTNEKRIYEFSLQNSNETGILHNIKIEEMLNYKKELKKYPQIEVALKLMDEG